MVKCNNCGKEVSADDVMECGACGCTECEECIEIEWSTRDRYGDVCPDCEDGMEDEEEDDDELPADFTAPAEILNLPKSVCTEKPDCPGCRIEAQKTITRMLKGIGR